jgi:quercetin dioxygenase-like cupin family protein
VEDLVMLRRTGSVAFAILVALTIGNVFLVDTALPEPSLAPNAAGAMKRDVTMTWVSKDTKTAAGEPVLYLSTPNPVISSNVITIQPGAVTEWMTHPVQAYIYVLEGTLTVEFAADGSRQEFKAGQAFLQSRTHWHRGRNDGASPVRFLGVFVGAKDVPEILHPPSGTLIR